MGIRFYNLNGFFVKKLAHGVNFFFNFLNDMVKQKSIATLNSLQSLEELQSLMSIKRVTLSFTDTALSNGNPFKYLMENSVFEYAELSIVA